MKTPWRDNPLMQDNRTMNKKVIDKILDWTPKCIGIYIFGFIQNYCRVRKIKYEIRANYFKT